MIRLYDLLPLVIRLRDAEASGGAGIDPILKRLTDTLLQEEAETHLSLVAAMKQLYDCLQVENPYQTLLFEFLGQQRAEAWTESLERFVLCETIPWHKISGTVHGWSKTMTYRLDDEYDFFELYKSEIYEVGDYNRHTNSSFPYRSARVALTPAGLLPYDWSTDTITCVGTYEDFMDDLDTPEPEVDEREGPEPFVVEIDYDATQLFFAGEKIVSFQRATQAHFGYGVAMDDTDLFIGEPLWSDPNADVSSRGRIHRYRQSSDDLWVLQEIITAPVTNPMTSLPFASPQQFGTTVYIEGDYLWGTHQTGWAWIFKRQGDGTFEQIDFTNKAAEQNLKHRIALGTHPDSGQVYAVTIYDDTGSEKIQLHQENSTQDGFEEAGAAISVTGVASIAANGRFVVVGRPYTNAGGWVEVGRVDVYEVIETSPNNLQLDHVKVLRLPDQATAVAWSIANEETGPQFGIDVAIVGSEIAVATRWPNRDVNALAGGTVRFRGGVYLFYDALDTGQFSYAQRLVRSVPNEIDAGGSARIKVVDLAATVHFGDGLIFVGSTEDHWDADFETYIDDPTGSLTIFEQVYGYNGYLESQTLTAFGFNGRQDADYRPADQPLNFGYSIAGAGLNLAVGAWGDNFDENGVDEVMDAGAVYTFQFAEPPPTITDDREVVVCEDEGFAVIPIGGLDVTYAADDDTSVLVQGDQLAPQEIMIPPDSFTGPFNLIGVRIRAWSADDATLIVNHALAPGETGDRDAFVDSEMVREYEFWWDGLWQPEDIAWFMFWVRFQTADPDKKVYITAAELIVRQVTIFTGRRNLLFARFNSSNGTLLKNYVPDEGTAEPDPIVVADEYYSPLLGTGRITDLLINSGRPANGDRPVKVWIQDGRLTLEDRLLVHAYGLFQCNTPNVTMSATFYLAQDGPYEGRNGGSDGLNYAGFQKCGFIFRAEKAVQGPGYYGLEWEMKSSFFGVQVRAGRMYLQHTKNFGYTVSNWIHNWYVQQSWYLGTTLDGEPPGPVLLTRNDTFNLYLTITGDQATGRIEGPAGSIDVEFIDHPSENPNDSTIHGVHLDSHTSAVAPWNIERIPPLSNNRYTGIPNAVDYLRISGEPAPPSFVESCLQACECVCQSGCEVACQSAAQTEDGSCGTAAEIGCTTTCQFQCQTTLETASCQGQCQVNTEENAVFSLPPSQDSEPVRQSELEACFEINKCLANTLRYTEALSVLNAYFRDQRPIHVLPVHCLTLGDITDIAPSPGDEVYARILGRFFEEIPRAQDSIEIIPDCTQGCMVSCETFCEVGCEDDCQGVGACENSCQLRCEADCQTDCEIVCQAGCVLNCQDSCQSFCQSSCEEVCQAGCEDLCQGTCEIVGCQLSCTLGCEDGCQFECQNSCEFECQSPSEVACETSCQEFCESCCEEECEATGGCQTTCEQICQASCVSGCELPCETNCQQACEGGCQSVCEFNCQQDCQSFGCEVACEGGCQGGCQSACEVICEGATCQLTCEAQGCQSCCECQCQTAGCESSCTTGCTDGCQAACESECQFAGGCETSCEQSCEASSEACTDCCELCCEGYDQYGCSFGSCESACEIDCQSACQDTCQTTLENIDEPCDCIPHTVVNYMNIAVDAEWDLNAYFHVPYSSCCDHLYWRVMVYTPTQSDEIARGPISANCTLQDATGTPNSAWDDAEKTFRIDPAQWTGDMVVQLELTCTDDEFGWPGLFFVTSGCCNESKYPFPTADFQPDGANIQLVYTNEQGLRDGDNSSADGQPFFRGQGNLNTNSDPLDPDPTGDEVYIEVWCPDGGTGPDEMIAFVKNIDTGEFGVFPVTEPHLELSPPCTTLEFEITPGFDPIAGQTMTVI